MKNPHLHGSVFYREDGLYFTFNYQSNQTKAYTNSLENQLASVYKELIQKTGEQIRFNGDKGQLAFTLPLALIEGNEDILYDFLKLNKTPSLHSTNNQANQYQVHNEPKEALQYELIKEKTFWINKESFLHNKYGLKAKNILSIGIKPSKDIQWSDNDWHISLQEDTDTNGRNTIYCPLQLIVQGDNERLMFPHLTKTLLKNTEYQLVLPCRFKNLSSEHKYKISSTNQNLRNPNRKIELKLQSGIDIPYKPESSLNSLGWSKFFN